MLSIAEIADRDGVSRPAVSQRVKRLVELHDLQVELDERGRVGAVNVAQYDLLRERNGDPSKDQRPSQPTEPVRVADSYDEALRQKTWYEATRKGLELDEQIGKLVRVDELAQAAADCGAEIAAIVGRIEGEADVLAAAGMRDGPHGLRVALKQIKARMLGEIAVALDNLAKLKPAATGESPDGN
jgi:DNA-binding Lrp family transcriptional regulator